ncbi:TetR/AcrR family transcriptional regulator [Agromyces sp. LHK192]|uniref:TetR/AcrR family transcriptional regulator n=1 Tax=Agromyces sp. LHK192 TaxID=2498704 RepID=UPI000FD954A8|nr:TetR/AcrR family transcriptional regulator [Agromyces sp. LHK192]
MASMTRTRRARRDDLIAATVRVIVREGIAAASIERIAAEAGTSKGTALYHFAGKEELYAAVTTSLFDAGRAFMTERILSAPDTPRDRIEAYLDSNLRFIADHVDHVVATQEIVRRTGAVPDGDAIAPLRAMLEAGQRDGSFGAFDADFVARMIRDLVDGAAYYYPQRPGLDREHFVAEGVGLVLRAIGAADRAGPR